MKRLLLSLCLAIFAGAVFGQVDTLLYEGFEGPMTWEVGDMYWYDDTDAYWHADTFNSHDGLSYWCGTLDVGGTGYNGYNDGWLQYLDMPAVSIPMTAMTATLTFKHKLNTEPAGTTGWPFGYDGWDGAAVWVSTDDGATWATLTPGTGSAYNCTSLWGFGFCGLGPGYAAWTGIHGATTFETITASLSDFAGRSVKVRFVFASDMMFSTGPTHSDADAFDSTMFGWIVDEIVITSDSDTLLYDSGSGASVASQGRELMTWEATTTDANTGSGCAVAYNRSETYSTLISPMISLADTFNGTLSFYIKTNCSDFDPDADNSLDDYIVIYVIDSTADTTVQMSHNYYRPGYIDETWRFYDESVLYDVTYGMRNSLLEFAGHDIQIMIMARGDGQPDESQWFKIDDITVSGNYAPLHDIAPTDVVTGPLNFRDYGRFTVKVSNLGMSDESLIQVNGVITFPDMHDTTMTFFPRPTIAPSKFGTAVAQLQLTQPGDYSIKVWTSLGTDLNIANDTFQTTFTVPGAEVRELGWDDGLNDVATDPTSGLSYNGFLGPSMVAGDCLGNFFYQTAGLQTLRLTHVKFFTKYSGSARVMVLDNGIFDIPNGGTELYDANHTIDSDPTNGSWVTVDLSASPVSLPDSTFFVFVGVAVDSQMPVVGIDNTTPVDRKGFAIIHYFDEFGTLVAIDTSDLASASAPLNNIDLMIRCVVTGITGVGEDGSYLPKELALKSNSPNPFNPTTAIEFDIPADQPAKLEVYNVLGEKVTTLVDDNFTAGTYRIIWEGRDDAGREMPSGIYLYRLEAGDKSISKRMVMLK